MSSCDLVVGVVLPAMRSTPLDYADEVLHFTREEAGRARLTGLCVRDNHDKSPDGVVGAVIGEAVRGINKRALLRLGPHTTVRSLRVAHKVATGAYRGLSLGNTVDAEDCSHVPPGAPMPAAAFVKELDELSVCPRGLRDFSNIEYVFPCRATLDVMSRDEVRAFAQRFDYSTHDGGDGDWERYMSLLERQLATRADEVIRAESLRQQTTPLQVRMSTTTDTTAAAPLAPPPDKTDAAPLAPVVPPAPVPPVAPPAGDAAAVAAAAAAAAAAPDAAVLAAKLKDMDEMRKMLLDSQRANAELAEKAAATDTERRTLLERERERERVASEAHEQALEADRATLVRCTESVAQATDYYTPEQIAAAKQSSDHFMASDPAMGVRQMQTMIDVRASSQQKLKALEAEAGALRERQTAQSDENFLGSYVQQMAGFDARRRAAESQMMAPPSGAPAAAAAAPPPPRKRGFLDGDAPAEQMNRVTLDEPAAKKSLVVAAPPELLSPPPQPQLPLAVNASATSSTVRTEARTSYAGGGAAGGGGAASLDARAVFERAAAKMGRYPTAEEMQYMPIMTGQVNASADGTHTLQLDASKVQRREDAKARLPVEVFSARIWARLADASNAGTMRCMPVAAMRDGGGDIGDGTAQ